MSAELKLTIPDDLMAWLASTAAQNYREPEGQLLWILSRACGGSSSEQPRDLDAQARLFADLRALRVAAGSPSIRMIADQIRGLRISHTSVHDTLSGKRLPAVDKLLCIVTALDGDTEHFRRLWLKARGNK